MPVKSGRVQERNGGCGPSDTLQMKPNPNPRRRNFSSSKVLKPARAVRRVLFSAQPPCAELPEEFKGMSGAPKSLCYDGKTTVYR